jgi:hypothetical protein
VPEDKPLPEKPYAGTGFTELDNFNAAMDEIPF